MKEDFFLTSILQAERTSYINKNLYKFRIHSNSMMKNKSKLIELYSYLIIYCEILKLTEKIIFNEEVKNFLLKDIKKLENNILSIYSNNNDNEIISILTQKLTIYQNIQLNKILQIKTIEYLGNNLNKNKTNNSLFKIINFIFTSLLIIFI